MNIIGRGRRFVQSLAAWPHLRRELATRSVWPQVAALPTLREQDHPQEWQLCTVSLDLRWATSSEGTAPFVPRLQAHLLRAISSAGAGQLVRAGRRRRRRSKAASASLRHRSVA